MIRIEQGGEYAGETYIWCSVHGARLPRPGYEATFEGESLAELLGFLGAHLDCDGQPGA